MHQGTETELRAPLSEGFPSSLAFSTLQQTTKRRKNSTVAPSMAPQFPPAGIEPAANSIGGQCSVQGRLKFPKIRISGRRFSARIPPVGTGVLLRAPSQAPPRLSRLPV